MIPKPLPAVNAEPMQWIPVNETLLTEAARQNVIDVMDSGWISSAGPTVSQFEQRFAEHLGVKHALTTPSGTTALHLAMATLGIGPGDEVIVPNFTMIAPVNAILYVGAKPVFVDCEPDIYTLDPALIERSITPRTKAIMPVHIYGHSADMDPILSIARAHRLLVVEDAAEAHGARYKGRWCGTMSDISAFSFYANKLVTTGEGGMLVTDNDNWAARARSLRDMAHSPLQRFVHTEVGFSYRMTSLQAAVGLGQLAEIGRFIAKKVAMADHYQRRLRGVRGLVLPSTRAWASNVYWMYAVTVKENAAHSRDAVRALLLERGIETRDFFQACARQPMFATSEQPAMLRERFPHSERAAVEGFYLPSGLALTPEQIDHVCDELIEILS